MKCVAIFFGIGCFVNFSLAQNSKREYIVRDTSFQMGSVTKLDDRNIRFRSGGSSIDYTADQIDEFGTSNGDIYESFFLNGQRKFAVRLLKGNVGLYHNRSTYILKKGTENFILTRKDYKEIIGSVTDCKLKYVPFKKKSLRSFVEDFNAQGCNTLSVPSAKFGIMTGFQPYSLQVTVSDLGSTTYSGQGSTFVAGIFSDFPLYKPRNLVVSAELYFVNVTVNFTSPDFNTDFKSIMVPLGLKWYFINAPTKIFIKPGTVLGYNQSSISHFDQNVNSVFAGFQVGTGVDKPLGDRTTLHAEIKYFDLNSTGNDYIKVGYSGLTFLVGISI